MKNAKKIMIGALAGAMIIGTAATAIKTSANVSFNYSSSSSSSENFPVEDSKGNEYDMTHMDLVFNQVV